MVWNIFKTSANKLLFVWQYFENSSGYGPTTTISFRNSEPGWLDHVERLWLADGLRGDNRHPWMSSYWAMRRMGRSRTQDDANQRFAGSESSVGGWEMGGSITGRRITCRCCDWLRRAKRHSDWPTETFRLNVVILRRGEERTEYEAIGCYNQCCR